MRPAFDSEAERIASAILTDIRRRGEPAIFAAIANIEKVVLKPSELSVSEAEFEAAAKAVAVSKKVMKVDNSNDDMNGKIKNFLFFIQTYPFLCTNYQGFRSIRLYLP